MPYVLYLIFQRQRESVEHQPVPVLGRQRLLRPQQDPLQGLRRVHQGEVA